MAVLAQRQCRADGAATRIASGHPEVAIVDFDPQGCLTYWHNTRCERSIQGPLLAEIRPDRLDEGLDHLEERGVRYALVDAPPGHSEIVAAAMERADMVVIPTRPGELDLAATMKTVMAAERLGVSYALVPNGANFRSRAMGEAIRLLRDAELPVLSPVHNRVGLTLAGGETATETAPASRGAEEIERLWAMIDTILKEMADV